MAKKVLVCDDSAFMRMMIKDILTKTDHDLAGEAENGRKAIEKYRELSPDLVLMDITMPEMDGIEALKEIMRIDPGAKVLLMGPQAQQSMADEAVHMGAKGFIVKPVQEKEVVEALKKVIG